jgi:hypothetical protein
LLRLPARAENEIDYNVKLLPPEFGLMVLKKLAITKNFFYALRRGGPAAMKDGDVMAALLKLLGCELSDETAAANEKDFHAVLLDVFSKTKLSQGQRFHQALLRSKVTTFSLLKKLRGNRVPSLRSG